MKFLIAYTIIILSMGSVAETKAIESNESDFSDYEAHNIGGINRTAEGFIVKIEDYGNFIGLSLSMKHLYPTPVYFIGSNADVLNKWLSRNIQRSTVEDIDNDIRDKVKLLEVCNRSDKRKISAAIKTLEYASKTKSKVRVVYYDNGFKLAGMCIESVAVLTNLE